MCMYVYIYICIYIYIYVDAQISLEKSRLRNLHHCVPGSVPQSE